ncbi:metallophosphoesterase [Pseudoxanthomonas sp. UTMC 1351]|uniref:metallophosphoesterase n=1 Tax=Pseudoxanthomonas sp. UTMC 1351 TaxID=2695853 RepID=UPI0034CD488A
MRIAVISDIHGNLGALSAVLADIGTRDCDSVVNLGDILSGPLQPSETADLLMPLALPTIRGNHERQLLEMPLATMSASDAYAHAHLRQDQRQWLAQLPASLVLNDGVLLCHGTPANDLEYFLEHVDADGVRPATHDEAREKASDAAYPVILCGHTHVPRAMHLADGRLIVNPGSVGLPAYHAEHPLPHNIENNSPKARYAVLDDAGGRWNAELIAVDYDHEAAARLAMKHGSPEWAYALRTGRVAPQEN